MALQAECKDMAMAVISLARAGALHSIGKVTSRASYSTQPLLCQERDAFYGDPVLAHAFSLLVKVMCIAPVEPMAVEALFCDMVMDFVIECLVTTRPASSNERVSDCSRAVVPVERVVTGSE